MIDQRRILEGSNEPYSDSENSYDEKIISQGVKVAFTKQANSNVARKFDRYLDRKAKIWHQNHFGGTSTHD
jgi:hypothetical protein